MQSSQSLQHRFFITQQHGFSLVELLTVLLICAIFITLSVGIDKIFIANHRSEAGVSSLMSGLYYARSAAVTGAEKISFCKSRDQKTCSGNWSDGQIVVNKSGKILQVFPALPAMDTLIWSSSLGKNDSLEWLPTGYTNGQRGSFYYCAMKSGVKASRVIVVLNTGRLYSADMTASDYDKYCKGG